MSVGISPHKQIANTKEQLVIDCSVVSWASKVDRALSDMKGWKGVKDTPLIKKKQEQRPQKLRNFVNVWMKNDDIGITIGQTIVLHAIDLGECVACKLCIVTEVLKKDTMAS